MSNRSTDDAVPFGAQHSVPRDTEELHGRTRQFLSTFGPTLDSIDALLNSWSRFREVSAATNGLPEKSSFRRVQIDPFTVWQPPPTVAEAEITQYIKKLSKRDLKALHDEYELTCVDGFEYVRANETAPEVEKQEEAHIVHFSSEAANDNVDRTAAANAGGENDDVTTQPRPFSESRVKRATALFESEATSVEPPRLQSDSRATVVGSSSPPDASAQILPTYSLEQISPFAVAAHERRRSTSSDSSYPGFRARSLPAAAVNENEGCTVEIEYESNHFIPSVAQRALRDSAGSAIVINPRTHRVSKPDTAAHDMKSGKMRPPLPPDSDGEVEKAEPDIQSFTTFSRIVLTNEGRWLTSQHAKAETPVSTEELQPVRAMMNRESRPLEGEAEAHASSSPPSSHLVLPTASVAPAKTTSIKLTNNADSSVSARDAFVRLRVHDIILANRVRAADATILGAAFFEKLDKAWNTAANQTTPVLEKLKDLLCESSALLHTVEVMDHQAYRKRVMDPARYLCVPRYSATCAALDCNAPFTATVTRVMCGRCGQFFCPSCCSERGLGPAVTSNDQQYSLGWEPLCRICFQMCRDSQRKLLETRNRLLRIGAVSSYHNEEDGDNGEDAARCASVDSLTLKQAVLFGAYCDEQRCLSDGLSPFYVMDRTAIEHVDFWDMLRYQLAKSKGSLRRGWQNAGGMAVHAVQSAAQMIPKRRDTLK